MEYVNICGVNVSAINLTLACDTICHWVENRKKAYVCVVPASTVVDCQSDEAYRRVINSADMATPDGMPIVWLERLKGYRKVERTYGPDLMLAICKISEEKGYKQYLCGSTPTTCERLESKLKEKFPKLKIVGRFSPSFGEISEKENEMIIQAINQSNPDILWLGLGSPKQDFWMYEHRPKLNVPVIVGVGAAFDFLSGVKKQAPRWIRNIGLEWFFRLCCEPRRLWKRYLIGNSKFIYFLFQDLITRK